MYSQRTSMNGGQVPVQQVIAMQGDYVSGLNVGAGTTQATAYALGVTTKADVYVFGTNSATAGTGATLDANLPVGDECVVVNGAATNAMAVYPPVGGAINGLATNAAYTLAANKGVRFKRLSSTVWVAYGA